MKTRTAIGSIALAAIAATACTGGGTPPCSVEFGPRGPGMPDLGMHIGDTARSDLLDHFGSRDCRLETPWTKSWSLWELRSSDSAAVAVSVSAEHVLETIALEVADSVLVRVHGAYHPPTDDFYDEALVHEFAVRVRAP